MYKKNKGNFVEKKTLSAVSQKTAISFWAPVCHARIHLGNKDAWNSTQEEFCPLSSLFRGGWVGGWDGSKRSKRERSHGAQFRFQINSISAFPFLPFSYPPSPPLSKNAFPGKGKGKGLSFPVEIYYVQLCGTVNTPI